MADIFGALSVPGLEQMAVEDAAEAAAARQRQGYASLRPPDAPAPVSTWGGLGSRLAALPAAIGHGLYEAGARPYRIWGALNSQPSEISDATAPDAAGLSPQVQNATAATSLDLMGLGTGLRLAPGGATAGIFGGELAKTADKAALARAKEMTAAGVDREKIFYDTGWFRGTDQQWRFEIPDNAATFNPEAMQHREYNIFGKLVPGREGAAGEVLTHPELFEAYPDLAKTVVGQTTYENNKGIYHPPTTMAPEQIGLDKKLVEGDADFQSAKHGARGTMLHELQHAIQEREGFGRGASAETTESIPNPAVAKYEAAVRNNPDLQRLEELRRNPARDAEIEEQNRVWRADYQPRLDEIYKRGRDYKPGDADQVFADFDKWKAGKFPLDEETDRLARSLRAQGVPISRPADTLSGFEVYKRHAGEVESRNVQERADMVPEDRRLTAPWRTQDVPTDEQIVRFGSLSPSASAMKRTQGLPLDLESRMARAREEGFSLPWYHGGMRMDRFTEKGRVDPRRATSGPMPFFTDNPEVASSYAMGKKGDTSLMDAGEVAGYFTINPKDLGWSSRTPLPVERTWTMLTPEQRATINERAPRLGWQDRDTGAGPVVLHPPGEHGGPSSADHWAYTLRENRGNTLAALRDLWHDSGYFVDDPGKLADVYRLAGYPFNISETNAPWTEARGVFPAALRLRNPLVTENVDELTGRVIPALDEMFKRDRTRLQPYGADAWDKNVRWTPRDWVAQLREDIAKGDIGQSGYTWSSIPDKVTAGLSRLGYDSILDQGGKGGGLQHRVAIPFRPDQVRALYGARFDPANIGKDFVLGANKPDARAAALIEATDQRSAPLSMAPDRDSHLSALQVRLSHERDYLARAKTEQERELRRVWIGQIEKEIQNERAFLGKSDPAAPVMSDDELLAELLGNK